ncbi:aminoglycoside phosphotransferase family protein [Cytobacillus sp. Sa5YUA1]|uniref:Aminoglycoside phosphotransferase family protein n=1 Tax=Cytobacillus stercorigallinarum TaxID=2762240 RepID=A0ABR8QN45_9BACI|nr:aminoglycoside phosphotransferase family protein [Cytobacillus stercorigallinarum]MBD7936956.1 aminoglycoside phosphotransferase family protein [Cytobacillus stercorigallinarum]
MVFDSKLDKQLKQEIRIALETEGSWQLEDISFIGRGVVNAVYLIQDRLKGKFAVRTPWQIEGESGEISLKKEYQLSKHCYAHGFPVAKVYQLYIGENINFLLSEYISGQHDNYRSDQIGEKINELHQLPVEGLSIIDQHNQSLPNIISTRIVDRLHQVNTLLSAEFTVPNKAEIEKILNTSTNPNVLMHLDVRPPNIFTENGRLRAFIDWDNAFIGDPIMELTRIFESKELDEKEFMKGYGESLLEQTDSLIQNIYRLDTTLMLSLLFAIDLKDGKKRTYYMNRTKNLLLDITKRM